MKFAFAAAILFASSINAATFTFTTGQPNAAMATASRPGGANVMEIESADDFILSACSTSITTASFYGLMPAGASLGTISDVDVEIYRVFPLDSTNPPSGRVPTRVNSPSDVAFMTRSSGASSLSFTGSVISASFAAANSVSSGINPIPNQTTGGDGPVTGEEVLIQVTFTTPIVLPAGHYFFVPQVALSSGLFFWLSGQRPNTITPIIPDLQSWIRNANLAPDWLRVGTDIVGGQATFNGAFSLSGTSSDVTVNASAPSPLNAVEGSAIAATTFSATGGTAPYTFSASGTLPSGVTLTSGGVLAGTPADEGTFNVTVTATDAGGCTGTLPYSIAVADAPLTAAGVAFNFVPNTPFSGTVATFHDANTAAPVSDFTATIDWNDGTTSAGTITSTGGGNFAVSGTHTYTGTGPFTVTTTIHDIGGSTATATAAATISPTIPMMRPELLALLAMALGAIAVRMLSKGA